MTQTRLCLTCSTPFEVPVTSHRMYCKRSCWPKQMRPYKPKQMVDVLCAHADCGRTFQREDWKVRQAKARGWEMYCKRECRDAAKRGRKGERRVARVIGTCQNPDCGREFEMMPSDARRRNQAFCTVECANAVKPGRPPKRDLRLVTQDGYVSIYVPPDERPPGGEKTARYAEHRYVMSRILGRWPDRYESVHHINGDKTDNRPENLQLRRVGDHGSGQVLRCRCCGSSDIEAIALA